MSELQTDAYVPPARVRKGTSVWLLALLLIAAVGALVAAVFWAGGPEAAGKMLGLNGFKLPGFQLPTSGGPGSQAPLAAAPASAPASSSAQAASLPPEALAKMYSEQVESHDALSALVNGQLKSFSFGTPQAEESSASLPIVVTLADGTSARGSVHFSRFESTWYFVSLKNQAEPPDGDEALSSVDSDVVRTITEQQAEKATQEMLAEGLLGEGYKKARVDGVEHGSGTATIDLTLSGGSKPDTAGRIVCISKTDLNRTYWFVVRFEKR